MATAIGSKTLKLWSAVVLAGAWRLLAAPAGGIGAVHAPLRCLQYVKCWYMEANPRRSLCPAGIFEFLGAVLLGGSVTRTISGGIARLPAFTATPALFMFGMLCAEAGACVWILVGISSLIMYAALVLSAPIMSGKPVYSGPELANVVACRWRRTMSCLSPPPTPSVSLPTVHH
jgi:hypothetical protein